VGEVSGFPIFDVSLFHLLIFGVASSRKLFMCRIANNICLKLMAADMCILYDLNVNPFNDCQAKDCW
jgi:hypothetical protein